MDSLTHVVMGASIAALVSGKSLGRKAMVVGAVVSTLPDLDVFWPFNDPVSFFTYHRSATHSLIVLTLMTPLIAWCVHWLCKNESYKKCVWVTWFCLIAHALLDACTVYGTQLFWPFMPPPVMGGSIFIIDPLYTLPLLVGFIVFLFKPQWPASALIVRYGLSLSLFYLALSLVLQQYVVAKTEIYAREQGVTVDKILATPTPFTISAWRVVAIAGDRYYEGFYGLLPGTRDFSWVAYERHPELAAFLQNNWAFERLKWFTNDYYKLARDNDKIYVSDLRMGFEPNYTFSFFVAKRDGWNYVVIPSERNPSKKRRSISDLDDFWCEKLWRECGH